MNTRREQFKKEFAMRLAAKMDGIGMSQEELAKQAEMAAHKEAAANAAKRQKILEVLEKKRDDSLNSMSENELIEMLSTIGG